MLMRKNQTMSGKRTELQARDKLAGARRWVVKVGSSLVTAKGQGLDLVALQGWGDQIARLRQGLRGDAADACPVCSYSNEPGSRFCSACGHALVESVAS